MEEEEGGLIQADRLVTLLPSEKLPREAQGTFTLKLWEHGGGRPITLQGITFPQLPL